MNAVIAGQAQHGVAAIKVLTKTRGHPGGGGLLLGVLAANIALVSNTSTAISRVAASIPWQTGDAIVCLRGEFPANTTPWQQAAREHGLRIVWLDANDFRTDDGLNRLDDALSNHRVRLVAVSAVQFSTGLRMPVESMTDIAHRHGAAVFVDAIQRWGPRPSTRAESTTWPPGARSG